MAKISSELSIRDGFSKNLNKYLNGIDNVIEAMDKAESSASRADFNMPKVSSSATKAAEKVNKVTKEVENLDSKSLGHVNSGFGGLSRTIITVNQGLDLLRRGYQMLSQVMTSVDERTSADARLSLIKDEIHTQDQLEAQIMAIANLTRSSYSDTADLIAKIARQDIFKGQNNKAIKFAENINKAFVVSGASVSEASNSIRQLTQALASGVLRGDEFNSVMENAPVLAEMIAKRLNITKGQMRELAAEGKLTAETITNAVLASTNEIDSQFNQMPMTFGQGMTVIQNKISELTNKLSEPGQAFSNIIIKVKELIAWLDTIKGQNFMDALAAGIGNLISALIWVANLVGQIYNFFATYTTIGSIILGIVAAFTALAVIIKTVTIVQAILNAVMNANPIILIISFIVGLIVALVTLWKTNISFRVGVIKIWNSILGFFDKIPVFFIKIANAVLDTFSNAKVGALSILQSLFNQAISGINKFISLINKVPGVNIPLIGKATFATETAAKEEAKKQARAANLEDAEKKVEAKASQRESKLQDDEAKWRAQAEAAEKKAKNLTKGTSADNTDYSNTPVDAFVTGGGLDKEVDLSSQTLRYLSDIAEEQALRQFEAMNKFMWIIYDDTDSKLNDNDKDILMSQAGNKTSVYYLQYQGNIEMNTEVKQGEDWETIKQKAKEETQIQIDIGLSDLDKVVCPQ